jgi:cobalamin biosynthesis protein CobD/CbiB
MSRDEKSLAALRAMRASTERAATAMRGLGRAAARLSSALELLRLDGIEEARKALAETVEREIAEAALARMRRPGSRP